MSTEIIPKELEEITKSLLIQDEALIDILNSLKSFTEQNSNYIENQKQFIKTLPKIQNLYSYVNQESTLWLKNLEQTIKFQEETYPKILVKNKNNLVDNQIILEEYCKKLGQIKEDQNNFIKFFKEFEIKQKQNFLAQQQYFDELPLTQLSLNIVNKIEKLESSISQVIQESYLILKEDNQQLTHELSEKWRINQELSIHGIMDQLKNIYLFQQRANSKINDMEDFDTQLDEVKKMVFTIANKQNDLNSLLQPSKKIVLLKWGSLLSLMISLFLVTPNQVLEFLVYVWSYFFI